MAITLPKNYLGFGAGSATNPEKERFVNNLAQNQSSGADAYFASQGGQANPMSPTDFFAQQQGGAPAPTGGAYGGQPNTPSGATVNQAGQLTAGGPSPAQSQANQYRGAFEQYLGTLQASPEEQAARQYLNSLLGQAEQDQEKALNMGDTLGFATGEAGRVGRQNSFAINAAARGLDALSGYRAASGEGAKARAEFEKNLLGMMQEDTPDGVTLSPGQQRFEYDPATGGYKAVASTPEDPLDQAYRQAQISNLQSEQEERKKNGENIYTDKNLPGDIRTSIIDDFQDKEFAKRNGQLTLDTVARLYPEVAIDTLRSMMDEFYDYNSLVEGEKKSWWQKFWGN